MIFIIILIGFLIFANMSPRSMRHRRHPYFHDYPPSYGHDVEYPSRFYRDEPYFQRHLPINTEGGYHQFQRQQTQQGFYYTLLFLVVVIAFLLYHNG